VIRALRAEPSAFAALDRLEPLPPDTDNQLVAVRGLARTWQAFLRGDLDTARALADGAIVNAPNIPLHELAIAVRIRLWQGDGTSAAATLATLDEPPRWGRASEGARRTLRAGLAALEGDPSAPARYREAVELWELLNLPLQRALCLLDRRRLLPKTSDDEELREVLALLDATGLAALAWPKPRARGTRVRSGAPRRGGSRGSGRSAGDPPARPT